MTFQSGPPPSGARHPWPFWPLLCAQGLIVLGVVLVILRVWENDLRVPLQFSRDALEYLMQAKGTIENGWWWWHPRLSAPGTFWQVAYPSNTNVDQAIVWIVSFFTRDVGLCLNISWLVMLVAAGAISTCCLRHLGLSRAASILGGTLFALSPYALYRGIEHLALVVYLVPVPCTAALLVATGRLERLSTRVGFALLFGCVLLGLNYVYYAFFGCAVILCGSVIAFARGVGARVGGNGLALVATICVTTALNLMPSAYAWTVQGKPLSIEDKAPFEAEVYGLKIRQLITPVEPHILAPLQLWGDVNRGAGFPLETENAMGRLGLLGTVGFAALLWRILIRGHAESPHIATESAAGQLTVFALLVGTIGGFGSLFNLLIDPNIRAYNRLFPFVHFFALAALGCLLDRLVSRIHPSRRSRVAVVSTVILLSIGIFDQLPSLLVAAARHDQNRAELADLRHVVRALESRLPPGAMVFQLPVTAFPANSGNARMEIYDQVKPYLVSGTLRWSFPAFDDALARWQRHVGELPLRPLAAAARAAGFTALMIDRRGYNDDAAAFLGGSGVDVNAVTLAASQRYVALDLRLIRTTDLAVEHLPRLRSTFKTASDRLLPCGETTLFSFDRFGANRDPAHFSRRAPLWGDITITGWAADARARRPARDVDVVLGGKVFPTFYGASRPDVAATLADPAYAHTGFTTRVPRGAIGRGDLPLSLRVVAADGSCFHEGKAIRVWVP